MKLRTLLVMALLMSLFSAAHAAPDWHGKGEHWTPPALINGTTSGRI